MKRSIISAARRGTALFEITFFANAWPSCQAIHRSDALLRRLKRIQGLTFQVSRSDKITVSGLIVWQPLDVDVKNIAIDVLKTASPTTSSPCCCTALHCTARKPKPWASFPYSSSNVGAQSPLIEAKSTISQAGYLNNSEPCTASWTCTLAFARKRAVSLSRAAA